jgi:flagellar biosynthesis protein FlhG
VSSSGDSPRIVAVASGKGGTGKSLIAANVGIYLATLGKRVVLVDAALGSANLHTFIGGSRPQRNLAEVLAQGGVHLREAAETTPVPGLRLVAGERDPVWVANPRNTQVKRLVEQVGDLGAEFVVLDLGSGTSGFLLELFVLADVGVVIATPEPTSVELCYRFVRAAFLRRLRQTGLAEASKVPAHELREFEGGMPSALALYRRALERDAKLGDKLKAEMAAFSPHLVINCARSKADMELGQAMVSAGRRRLGLPLVFLGHCEYDEAVWVALRRKRPLLIEHPESRVAKCIEKLARRLMAHDGDRVGVEPGSEESNYDLLGVAPTASFEDIRRANRRVREIYGHESVVVSGLYTREQLDDLHRRLDEAYGILMDAPRRKAYDHELFPDGVPSQAILGDPAAIADRVRRPPTELPPMPEVSTETEYTGPLLKQIRESQGIDLREISERTKIGMTYLGAIESETFKKLPAVVYVRGFLVEYAKILGIDPERVLATYLERYKAVRNRLDAEE